MDWLFPHGFKYPPDVEQRLARQRRNVEVGWVLEPMGEEPVHLFVLSRFPLALALLDLRFPPAPRLPGSLGRGTDRIVVGETLDQQPDPSTRDGHTHEDQTKQSYR